MNKLISLIAFCFFSLYGYSQERKPVQTFTPEASELGKYGQIPVNYFNGLPDISIPLTTFKAKGYELPIYLTYHASGNNPDSHPGWVGLGWTLHAGGMINRIVNDEKDEQSKDELFYIQGGSGYNYEPGYLNHTDLQQKNNWNTEEFLNSLFSARSQGLPITTEPDEFQINMDDIQASFYIVGDNEIKIKSKNNVHFKADIRLNTSNSTHILYRNTNNGYWNLESKLFTYIEEIIITKEDGIKYYFGGDKSAIEFSFIQMPKYAVGINTNEWKSIGTANSWLLKKIELPNGETITFAYEKKGTPIVMYDNHYENAYILNNSQGDLFDSKQSRDMNISFVFLQPSYLTSIKSSTTENEIVFGTSKSNELAYNITKDVFEYRVGNFYYYDGRTPGEFAYSKLKAEDYYLQLYAIVDKNKKIRMMLSNDAQKRLKLQSVVFSDLNDRRINSYDFEYNDAVPLPAYNSKETDHWGYYNHKNYGTKSYAELKTYRTPDAHYMQAEILKKITYPTGGYTELSYEPHQYSMVAHQFPFEIKSATGMAGGLRIKEIVNFNHGKKTARTFEYTDDQGHSSGILSGDPIYYIFGKQHVKWTYKGWWGLVYETIKVDYTGHYHILSENNLHQLSTTNGSHITYSRVAEKLSDGSKVIYHYTNHDRFMDELPELIQDNIDNNVLSNKFTSKELERGLLTKTEYIDSQGRIVKTEENSYNSNPNRYNEFVKVVNQTAYWGVQMLRLSAIKIYTFCPYLESQTVTTNDTPGLAPVITTTHFEYNAHQLPSKTITTNSRGGEETQVIRYPCDIPNGIYPTMQSSSRLSLPVEKIQLRDGYVIGSELTTYKKNPLNSDYVPDKVYKLHLNVPIAYSNFVCFNGVTMDSHYGKPEIEYTRYDRESNITEAIQKDFHKATYYWSDDGLNPVATFENARNTYSVVSQYQDVWATEYISLKYFPLADNVKNYEFYTSKSGTVEFCLSGALGYNWFVTGNLDGKPITLVQIRSSVDAGLPWTNYQTAYTYKATFTGIPAGYHIFRLQATDSYKGPTAGNYDGDLSYSYWQKESTAPEITGSDDVFYENFESFPSTAVPFGFHSDKSYLGAYTASLHSNPGKAYSIDYQVYRGGKWHYVKQPFSNGSYTIDEGNDPIDDVRVYPDTAVPVSFSYFPFVGLRSKTDDKGVTESYEYDLIGRLTAIRDNERNIIKQFDYHYYNESSDTGLGIPYFSVETRRHFIRNNCNASLGEIGKSVEYVVPAGKYTSSISQEDANMKAYNDLVTNGQQYANEHAECGAYVIVSVYNPSESACVLNYDWGVQGNITTDRYDIPASPRIADTDDLLRDFQPTIVYIPRRNYRQVYIFPQGNASALLNFSMRSSAYGDVFYDVSHYPEHEDVYVIGGYPFDY